jgi:UDP-N-acetylmuramoyl-L-alanyl-D-glutamate--2,6-diaminopimelate ligase
MLDHTLNSIKRLIPSRIFGFFQPIYHWKLAFLSAIRYGFPSRNIKVIAVTGTKGKSTTTEALSAILEEAGHTTALSNTIRFKIGSRSVRNLYKMSMPGRFAMQRMIRAAVGAGCDYFICEMTSQGSLLHRHKFIAIDTLIFTNLSPEHIEAHGSYENYAQAKLDIARSLATSGKQTTLIVNADDKEAPRFLACAADTKLTYSLADGFPYETPLHGDFNKYNLLAAATCARHEGVPEETIARAIAKFAHVPGRVEKIDEGQDFDVIVDYAHTADSLEKLYKVFAGRPLIGVLGGTGGGRDTAKRAVMGSLADRYCKTVILTDEDPYDEDPRMIVDDVARGVTSKKPLIIMDRREAIREAIRQAHPGDVILVTGKGTDPYIMGPHGTKTPWSDADIAREELRRSRGSR